MTNILIIDDDPQVILHLRELLGSIDFTPLFIANPKLLYPILADEQVDLILLDLYLPIQDGLSILKELKKDPRYKHIPIIMLTSEDNENILNECFQAEAADFLTKPVKKMELLARIRTVLMIIHEQKKYRELLSNILPESVSQDILTNGFATPRLKPQATVGFTDFVNFTEQAQPWGPNYVLQLLQEYFNAFDHIINSYGLEKIKTIGDSYMYAGGVPEASETHAIDCVRAALDISNYVNDRISGEIESELSIALGIRIGIHTGPLISGVLMGKKTHFDIWGDTVNTAHRMESYSVNGEITMSQTTYEVVKEHVICEQRQLIEIKGKGKMLTYHLQGMRAEANDDAQ